MKYLFTARFIDGHEIQQTPEDVSSIEVSKSAYHDVLSYPIDLESFTLQSDDKTVVVDLQTGIITTDGVAEETVATEAKRKLIYWRHRKVEHFGDGTNSEVPSQFIVGWEANEVKQVVVVE